MGTADGADADSRKTVWCGRCDPPGAVEVSSGAAFCPKCGGRLAAGGGEAVIELSGVSKTFGGRLVLDGLGMRVQQGENVVIVGMTGSGKTVLMEHIVGFQRPDSGRVWVAGVEVGARAGERELRRVRAQVGLVFQGSALLDSLTVLENVLLPLGYLTPRPSGDERLRYRQRALRSSKPDSLRIFCCRSDLRQSLPANHGDAVGQERSVANHVRAVVCCGSAAGESGAGLDHVAAQRNARRPHRFLA